MGKKTSSSKDDLRGLQSTCHAGGSRRPEWFDELASINAKLAHGSQPLEEFFVACAGHQRRAEHLPKQDYKQTRHKRSISLFLMSLFRPYAEQCCTFCVGTADEILNTERCGDLISAQRVLQQPCSAWLRLSCSAHGCHCHAARMAATAMQRAWLPLPCRARGCHCHAAHVAATVMHPMAATAMQRVAATAMQRKAATIMAWLLLPWRGCKRA